MIHRATPSVLTVSLVLLAVACGPPMQRITVQTDPTGAAVSLQRSGEVDVSASVAGVGGSLGAGSFTEDFISLGNSPVDYEFQVSRTGAEVGAGGGGGQVKRRYTEGLIRIALEGYRTVERRVRFSGDRIALDIDLQPRDGD
jgi:hypothetical protein